MTDPYKLAAMRILSSVVSAAHFASPDLLPLLVLKQVNLSIKYGNTSLSAYAYATYGLILAGELIGDIETGYQFGQLALGLLDKFQAKEIKAKTLLIFNYFIRHWREHLRETLSPLQDAYAIGLETGDIEYAAYSACVYCYHSYVLGKNLATVEQEMAKYSEALSQLQQNIAFYYNQLNRQVVLNLMGRSDDPRRLIGASYDETKMLPMYLEAQAKNICHSFYFYKLVLGYLFHDYQQALENAKLVEASSDSARGTIPLAHFYTSLLHLAIYPDTSKSQQKQLLNKVNANQKRLKKWAQFAPMTHQHKFDLVEAERHRVLGETTQAIECYDRAIVLAREQGYINEAALANELAGKFYLGWGKAQIAQVYMTNAYSGYLYWGATAKTKDLEQHYPQLVKRPTHTSSESENSLSIDPSYDPGERLDLAALMKASQAIASEMEWENLLSTLIKILLAASGAQTGYLMLDHAGKLLLEASGDVNSEQVTVWQGLPIEPYLPASIIYYVARTQKGLIESNGARDGRFKQDNYIQTHRPKSILCAPVLNQGQLIGVVYLENKLADRMFTPDRLEMVQLLSQIAAIALRNATLYRQIQESQSRLNTYLNAIPVGISVYDAKGQLIYANPVSQKLLNPQTQTCRIYRAGTGNLYPMEQLPLIQSLAGEKAWADDLEVHCGDQSILLEASSTPIFDETGTVEYVIVAFQDIRDRKQAETTRLENVRLEQEIRDRRKTATELERARDAAEATNRAKSTFLANISHELRTPLNAILGFSQLMNQDANLSTEQQENLTIIHRSGEHLLTLINQVLDLSKVEAGRMVLSETNFDLHHLLVDIKDIFSLTAKEKGLTLQFNDVDGVPQYIVADQVKLRQVLINLIGNAIKFTSSGSVSVNVKCYNEEDPSVLLNSKTNADNTKALSAQVESTILSIAVQDTGVGIAGEELDNLFQPFVQTQVGQRMQQGTGLGLTISHKFVRLMGGEMTVISRGKVFTPGRSVRDGGDGRLNQPSSLNTPPASGTVFQFDIPVGIGDAIAINNQSQKCRLSTKSSTIKILPLKSSGQSGSLSSIWAGV